MHRLGTYKHRSVDVSMLPFPNRPVARQYPLHYFEHIICNDNLKLFRSFEHLHCERINEPMLFNVRKIYSHFMNTRCHKSPSNRSAHFIAHRNFVCPFSLFKCVANNAFYTFVYSHFLNRTIFRSFKKSTNSYV